MAVQEGQHLPGSIGGADQTCPDQTLSLFGADETHAVQIADVASQLGLQVAWISNVEEEELRSRHAGDQSDDGREGQAVSPAFPLSGLKPLTSLCVFARWRRAGRITRV